MTRLCFPADHRELALYMVQKAVCARLTKGTPWHMNTDWPVECEGNLLNIKETGMTLNLVIAGYRTVVSGGLPPCYGDTLYSEYRQRVAQWSRDLKSSMDWGQTGSYSPDFVALRLITFGRQTALCNGTSYLTAQQDIDKYL
jgi:hypothetical protein